MVLCIEKIGRIDGKSASASSESQQLSPVSRAGRGDLERIAFFIATMRDFMDKMMLMTRQQEMQMYKPVERDEDEEDLAARLPAEALERVVAFKRSIFEINKGLHVARDGHLTDDDNKTVGLQDDDNSKFSRVKQRLQKLINLCKNVW